MKPRKPSVRDRRREARRFSELLETIAVMAGTALDDFGPDLKAWPDQVLSDLMQGLAYLGPHAAGLVLERPACRCGCTPYQRVDLGQLLAGLRHDA